MEAESTDVEGPSSSLRLSTVREHPPKPPAPEWRGRGPGLLRVASCDSAGPLWTPTHLFASSSPLSPGSRAREGGSEVGRSPCGRSRASCAASCPWLGSLLAQPWAGEDTRAQRLPLWPRGLWQAPPQAAYAGLHSDGMEPQHPGQSENDPALGPS